MATAILTRKELVSLILDHAASDTEVAIAFKLAALRASYVQA